MKNVVVRAILSYGGRWPSPSLLLLVLSSALDAQGLGSNVGTVVDRSGAVVAAAKVTITTVLAPATADEGSTKTFPAAIRFRHFPIRPVCSARRITSIRIWEALDGPNENSSGV